MNWAVYLITNKINKKIYVGICNERVKTIYDRFEDHITISNNGGRVTRTGKPFPIYAAISKYGEENFKIEYLEKDLDLEDAKAKEISYIIELDSFARGKYGKGYNISKGGEDPDWDPDEYDYHY